jgi:hypothetical protein
LQTANCVDVATTRGEDDATDHDDGIGEDGRDGSVGGDRDGGGGER